MSGLSFWRVDQGLLSVLESDVEILERGTLWPAATQVAYASAHHL